MFTGIITDQGVISSIIDAPQLRRFEIACTYAHQGIEMGASIACNGVCLTVVEKGEKPINGKKSNYFSVEAAAETLAITSAAEWKTGDTLNLERSLKIGDELGGHLVSGHVDGLARIENIQDIGKAREFTFVVEEKIARFIAAKGSICLNGTSLTVNTVQGNSFSVLLIPHSLAVTNWAALKTGDALNCEIDVMARYAARLSEFPQYSAR